MNRLERDDQGVDPAEAMEINQTRIHLMHFKLLAIPRIFAASLLLTLGSYGCSHLEVQEIPITADATEEIGKLAADLSAAEAKQVDVLSPENFQNAAAALREANASRSEAQDTKVILNHVAEGRAHLGKANATAQVSRSALAKVIAVRTDAISAGAPKETEEEFKEVDKDLVDATEAIENEDLSVAEANRAALVERYADLELRAIKKSKLGIAVASLDQAVKEGAKENAGRTLTEAQKTLAAAESFIAANRHDKAGIQEQADAATASAKRVLTISREAKVTGKKDAEAVVLERETQQNQLNAATAAGAKQATALTRAQGAAQDLESANSQLEAEKQIGVRLDAAKARFSATEAEVYRDGDQLIIRLKQLAFPSGKATLAENNFPLLAKVQSVIQDLGASHVTVEGHTDTSGTKAANQKLSDQRAAAIGGYLTANGVASGDLSTIGYGDTKPIAPNKSKEGRAQNRRVDVIIKPTIAGH